MTDSQEQSATTEDEDRALPPGTVDGWVAANVRARREELGMTQPEFVRQMNEFGYRWPVQIISRVENNQRKVTIGEAEAIARVLQTSLTELTWPDVVSNTVNFLGMFTGRAASAFQRITDATGALLFAREHLEHGISEARRLHLGNDGRVAEALEDAEEALKRATPERAVEAGREDHAQTHGEVAGGEI